jgi:hypothetical protein
LVCRSHFVEQPIRFICGDFQSFDLLCFVGLMVTEFGKFDHRCVSLPVVRKVSGEFGCNGD